MSKKTLTTMICYEQGEVRWRFDLSKRKLLVGSFDHADIQLDDPHISTYHAMMTIDNGIINVIDLQSDNGVWVNGPSEKVVQDLLPQRLLKKLLHKVPSKTYEAHHSY